jgi:hypothetical protein
MPRKPQLTEPLVIDRLWANRRHDAVCVTLSTSRSKSHRYPQILDGRSRHAGADIKRHCAEGRAVAEFNVRAAQG